MSKHPGTLLPCPFNWPAPRPFPPTSPGFLVGKVGIASDKALGGFVEICEMGISPGVPTLSSVSILLEREFYDFLNDEIRLRGLARPLMDGYEMNITIGSPA